jgi:serine carboxypeptidase-like clade 2
MWRCFCRFTVERTPCSFTMHALAVVFVFLFFGNFQASGQSVKHKIVNLPGWNGTNFDMYTGYITINNGKHMFYWFVESQGPNPANDPVVLWLNGGPGCSSLLGLMAENGPFYPDENNNLALNPYSWNLFANMLYLESPAGVGFSYWNKSTTFVFTDNVTATDNLEFLIKWFQLFPQYSQNPFFISGESYAGHYIPTLVYVIAQLPPTSPPVSNFKGFLVGNPSTDVNIDKTQSLLLYYQTHGIVPLTQNTTQHSGFFDPYDLLNDVCHATLLADYIRFPNSMNIRDDPKRLQRLHERKERYLWQLKHKSRHVPNRPACIDDYVHRYLNTPSVQLALRVRPKLWSQCASINYHYNREYSMIPIYQWLIANTFYRILVYSGDQDTVINFLGTEQWTFGMKLPVIHSWMPWCYDNGPNNKQIAGWGIDWNGLSFMTHLGAGHMVPWSQPAPALLMFQNFIRGGNVKTIECT